ncbi:MAG: RHS repeat-associated core domain-containing protein [Candidatus Kapaibacterium sp.]
MSFWKYLADVKNISNMYPYGKSYGTNAIYNASEDYRYGFNGMEKEKNMDASGDITDFGARVFDANFPMFLSPDPMESKYPDMSPFAMVLNNPVNYKDSDGKLVKDQDGNVIITDINKDDKFSISDKSGSYYFLATKSKIMSSKGNSLIVYKANTPEIVFDSDDFKKGKYDNSCNCVGNALGLTNLSIYPSDFSGQFVEDEMIGIPEKIEDREMGVYLTKDGVLEHMERIISEDVASSKGGVQLNNVFYPPGKNPIWSDLKYYSFKKHAIDIRVLPTDFVGPLAPYQISMDLKSISIEKGLNTIEKESYDELSNKVKKME